MNGNIFGAITSNPYAPSGILNAISSELAWRQNSMCINTQDVFGAARREEIPQVVDDKIKLLRTTNYISLK